MGEEGRSGAPAGGSKLTEPHCHLGSGVADGGLTGRSSSFVQVDAAVTPVLSSGSWWLEIFMGRLGRVTQDSTQLLPAALFLGPVTTYSAH